IPARADAALVVAPGVGTTADVGARQVGQVCAHVTSSRSAGSTLRMGGSGTAGLCLRYLPMDSWPASSTASLATSRYGMISLGWVVSTAKRAASLASRSLAPASRAAHLAMRCGWAAENLSGLRDCAPLPGQP